MDENDVQIQCRFCVDEKFETSLKLFEHLLVSHNSEHNLCSFCHRYFYSKSEFDDHISLHKSDRKGYIQCVNCSHNCLSKVTSLQHAAKHYQQIFCVDLKPFEHPRKLQSLGVEQLNENKKLENSYENGFSLFSISCNYRSKTNVGETFQCRNCKKRYNNMEEFVSHRIIFGCCEINDTKESANEDIQHTSTEQVISLNDISQNVLSNSAQNILDIAAQEIMDDSQSSMQSTNIISIQSLPMGNNLRSSLPDTPLIIVNSDKLQDFSLEQDSSVNSEVQSNFTESDKSVPIVKFVVKSKENIATTSYADAQKYISADDDPIAEFLKIPVKNFANTKTPKENLSALKSKQISKLSEIQTTRTKSFNKDLPNQSKLMMNVFSSTSPETTKEDHEYTESETSDDQEKEQIYLKEVKTLEMLTCELCKQMFSSKHFLNQHKEVHKKYIMQNKYFCRFCNYKRFPKVTALLEHVTRIHKTAKLYKCNICSEDFGKQVYFSKHIKEVHSFEFGQFRFDDESGYIIFKIRDGPEKKQLKSNPTKVTTHQEVNENVSDKNDSNERNVSQTCVIETFTNESQNLVVSNPNNVHPELSELNDIEESIATDNMNQSLPKDIEDEMLVLSISKESTVENNSYNKEDKGDDSMDTQDLEDAMEIEELEFDDPIEIDKTSQDSHSLIMKEAIVVLEDIKKSVKNTKLKRSERLQNKRVSRLKKKKNNLSKKSAKAKPVTTKDDVILKKTNSNIIIKVNNSDDTKFKTLKKSSEVLKYRCHFCSKRFKDNLTFNLHVKGHFQEDSFLCVCGVRLTTKEQLDEHKRKYHMKNDNADILLIKLNEETYMFVQQGNSTTLQGTLKKVNVSTDNPLKFTKVPENTEYMGDVILTRLDESSDMRTVQNKQPNRNGIIIKRITPEDAKQKAATAIKMTPAREGIVPLAKPFEVRSTYVCPDLNSDMYSGVTHVTKLVTRKRINTNFVLNYDRIEMPNEINEAVSSTKKTYAKRVKPFNQDTDSNVEGFKLVSANPLAHLLGNQTVYPLVTKTAKKKKDLDYEAIIKKNLSDMSKARTSKKK